MSDKKLHNRLKNLFDDLHDQAEQPQSGPDQRARPPEADGQAPDKPGTAARPGDSPERGAPEREFRASATTFSAPDLPAIPAPSWPRAGSHTFGFRADESQVVLATEALTHEGRESLITEAPVRTPAEDGRPAVLAVSIASERSPNPTQPDTGSASARLLLEILSTEENREWSEDEMLLVNQVADQLALALENARLFQSTQQALDETASLYEASAAMNEAQSYDDIITYLRRYTVLGRMDLNLSLNLFDRTWQADEPPGWVTSVAQWNPLAAGGGLRRPLEALPVADLLAPDAPLLIADIPADPRLNEQARRLYSERLPGRSAIFVPLVVAGKWIGYIHGLHRQTLEFETEAIKRLMALAGQAAVALQNLVQLHASQARAQREYLIREIGAQVSASLDMETIMKTTARSLSQAMGASHVAVRLTGAPAESENPGPVAPAAQPPAADNFGQEPEA